MRLIGRECKCSNVLSWPILIGRGLDLKELRESDLNEIESRRNNFYELNLWKDLKLKRVLLCSCQFLEEENWTIVVTIARRIHLFPFRTQKLSFSTPKVVNGTLFARIGSCHFHSWLAQSVERSAVNRNVVGSSPTSGAIIADEKAA